MEEELRRRLEMEEEERKSERGAEKKEESRKGHKQCIQGWDGMLSLLEVAII